MLETLISVPAVTASAAVTVVLFVRDMFERESARDARPVLQQGGFAEEGRTPVRYLWSGLACMVVFVVLVTLRFLILAG